MSNLERWFLEFCQTHIAKRIAVTCFIISFLCLFIVFGWALGKAVGWIHSPMWVNMLPIMSGALSIITVLFGGFLGATSIYHRFLHMEKEVRKIDGIDSRLLVVETMLRIKQN